MFRPCLPNNGFNWKFRCARSASRTSWILAHAKKIEQLQIKNKRLRLRCTWNFSMTEITNLIIFKLKLNCCLYVLLDYQYVILSSSHPGLMVLNFGAPRNPRTCDASSHYSQKYPENYPTFYVPNIVIVRDLNAFFVRKYAINRYRLFRRKLSTHPHPLAQ